MNKNYSIHHGMPISMEELKKRTGNTTFQDLIKHTVENTNVCIITNNNGLVLETVPVIGNVVPFVDINLLRARGWSINITPSDGHKFSALTKSFWNCECGVHHKIVSKCTKCGKNSEVKQMPYVEDILGDLLEWDFIVGEKDGIHERISQWNV